MRVPVIGVLPLWNETHKSMWMISGYMDGIINAGGIPVMLPLTSDKSLIERIANEFDGFLFTGGPDVHPAHYGEEVDVSCGSISKERDDMELMLFAEAVLSLDKPAFGICRGLQLFNTALGGTLYQDLPTQFKCERCIEHRHDPSNYEPSHFVSLCKDSSLHRLIKENSIKVNTSHHQGIKDLASGLECIAVTEDGLIEAVQMPDKRFVWAVQWHPERTLYDQSSQQLFDLFVESCHTTAT